MKTIEIECSQRVRRCVTIEVSDEQYELLMSLEDDCVRATHNPKEYKAFNLIQSLVDHEDPYDFEDEYTDIEIREIND